jgi:nucleoside-diphosphate-sugar epimerase
MRVAVAGATGFIGAVLAEALMEDGHDVTALTRRPDDYTGAARAVHADVGDGQSLRRELDGRHEAAYYLVHSLAVEDFAVRDRECAAAFAAAATPG